MFSKIKKDFDRAIEKIKWFASFLSERVTIEIAVFKLIYKSEELKKRRNELLGNIGEEVYKMRGKDRDVYANKEVKDAILKLESIESEINETVKQASEISKAVT